MGYNAGFRYFIMFLVFLMARTSSAEVGYGPGFDSCGDVCQTELRLSCTELKDAAQQAACWCGDVEKYFNHMDTCLATCSKGYERQIQRGVLTRFRGVVCGEEDEEFEEYYRRRYGGEFAPGPINNAPPAPLMLNEANAPITTSSSATRTRTITRSSSTRSSTLTTSTRATSSQAVSMTPSSSTSTASPSPTADADRPQSSDSGSSDSNSDRLPVGAIAGIVAGSTSAVLALLVAALLIRRRKKHSEKSASTTPPLNWPPNLERRVSVYYSPDDVGRTPTTPRAATVNGGWVPPHPGQRVPSVATTIIEDSASDYDRSSSEGSGSTWTEIEGADVEFYDVDLGTAR